MYIIPDASPNAFATGRNPSHAAVAATEGILQILTDPELEGVIAHELAHVKHRDILISSVAATIAAAIMFSARMAQFAAFFGGYGGSGQGRDRGNNPLALLATIILAPIAAMLIQMAISRSREFSADAGGARIAGTPYGLADALRKIDAGSKRVPLDGQSRYRAHVHHESVLRPRADVPVQQPSPHGRADSGAARRGPVGSAAAASPEACTRPRAGARPFLVLSQTVRRDSADPRKVRRANCCR